MLLGHLDRDRLELAQKAVAAERPPADSQTPKHLGLIPHADLPQLDPGAEDRGQVLDQLPEVDPPVGGEIEKDFVVVEGVLHVHQLHVELVLLDFLQRDLGRLLFVLAVLLNPLEILLVGRADQRL